jgi:hypothetical protein
MDDEQLQRGLEQMSGNPALANQIKQSLRQLNDGRAGPGLAELARDVLAGRTDLRTIAQHSAYANQLTDAIQRFHHWYTQLTPDERDQLADDTRAYLLDGHDNPAGP